MWNLKNVIRDFPGGPVVRTLCSHCQGPGLIPGWGTKIPPAVLHGQKKKKDTNELIYKTEIDSQT